MRERINLVDNEHVLSIRRQCEILSVHRSGLYYKPQGEKKDNLEIMRIMDEHYLKHATWGVRWYDVVNPAGVTFRPYTAIFTHLIPALKNNGFTDQEIFMLLQDNPKEAYTIKIRKM